MDFTRHSFRLASVEQKALQLGRVGRRDEADDAAGWVGERLVQKGRSGVVAEHKLVGSGSGSGVVLGVGVPIG